ncbi:MaoC family dehydratase N-terminal domain-containing protein [Streptomyces sp. NPDC005811]|uniref:FAS1-like dehydratase domain-containing protein n=1 Tax=Streptomyces sp. NPDC005811 TaxID=3154565 RepID=UPI0033FAF15A
MSGGTTRDEGRSVRFKVEEGAVRQFRRAVQWPTGEDTDAAPWTFPMTVDQWFGPEDKAVTGFDRARLLHGSQEFFYPNGPLEPGMELVAQERLVERFEKRGSRGGLMRFAVVETTFTDARDGKVAARMRSTLIERGGAPS